MRIGDISHSSHRTHNGIHSPAACSDTTTATHRKYANLSYIFGPVRQFECACSTHVRTISHHHHRQRRQKKHSHTSLSRAFLERTHGRRTLTLKINNIKCSSLWRLAATVTSSHRHSNGTRVPVRMTVRVCTHSRVALSRPNGDVSPADPTRSGRSRSRSRTAL